MLLLMTIETPNLKCKALSALNRKFLELKICHKRHCSQAHNKRFKRDCQRVAFPVPLNRIGYGCWFKLCGSVASPLSGRCAAVAKYNYHRI